MNIQHALSLFWLAERDSEGWTSCRPHYPLFQTVLEASLPAVQIATPVIQCCPWIVGVSVHSTYPNMSCGPFLEWLAEFLLQFVITTHHVNSYGHLAMNQFAFQQLEDTQWSSSHSSKQHELEGRIGTAACVSVSSHTSKAWEKMLRHASIATFYSSIRCNCYSGCATACGSSFGQADSIVLVSCVSFWETEVAEQLFGFTRLLGLRRCCT